MIPACEYNALLSLALTRSIYEMISPITIVFSDKKTSPGLSGCFISIVSLLFYGLTERSYRLLEFGPICWIVSERCWMKAISKEELLTTVLVHNRRS